MRYRQLGNSGLTVSVVTVGCNSFGNSCDEATSHAVVGAALDNGINVFDAASAYGGGLCEQYLGAAIKGRRDEVVITTKAGGYLKDSPTNAPGSRRYIVRHVEDCLKRLGTDYIDLFSPHHPDPDTPIEETLRALDDLVRAGKIRYIGSSNLKAWQIVEAELIAQHAGLNRFVATTLAYSLIDRNVELEVGPVCSRYGIGVMPYFPLAVGLLSGAFKRGDAVRPGTHLASRPDVAVNQQALDAAEQLEKFALDRGLTLLDVAIGGLAAKPAVASVVAGVSRPEQVVMNARAAEWVPTPDDLDELDRIARPAKYIPLGSRTGHLR